MGNKQKKDTAAAVTSKGIDDGFTYGVSLSLGSVLPQRHVFTKLSSCLHVLGIVLLP